MLNFLSLACWKWESEALIAEKAFYDPYDTQKLRVLAVTWNMHGKLPKSYEDLNMLLRAKEIHHDIYVIGTQEC